jgi:RNA polymerase-binding transcription factor DksA
LEKAMETIREQDKDLQRELEGLRLQMTALEAALEEKPKYGFGRGDPSVTHWELNQAMLERLKERAARLEQALLRTEEGTYGLCVQCGKPIHPDRLAVLPGVKTCIHCARAKPGAAAGRAGTDSKPIE